MPKSLTINELEEGVSCDALASLQAEYQMAVRDFTKSVKKVRAITGAKTTLNTPHHAKQLDPERFKWESAYRALRNHILEHGCC
jgi:hypothetical protein